MIGRSSRRGSPVGESGSSAGGQAAIDSLDSRPAPTVGAMAVGVAQFPMGTALEYACQREQFGRQDGQIPGRGVQARGHEKPRRLVMVWGAGWMARNNKNFD